MVFLQFIKLNEHDSGKRTNTPRAVVNTGQVLRRLLRPVDTRVHPHIRHIGRRKGSVGGSHEANDKKIETVAFLIKIS